MLLETRDGQRYLVTVDYAVLELEPVTERLTEGEWSLSDLVHAIKVSLITQQGFTADAQIASWTPSHSSLSCPCCALDPTDRHQREDHISTEREKGTKGRMREYG